MERQCARRLRIGLTGMALALATGAVLAVQTHEVEIGRGGVYDGTVTIGRDAQGRLVFRDADVTTSATLESLVGGGLTSIPDPLVPADGTQNVTGAVAATGVVSGSNLAGTNTGDVTVATAGCGLTIAGQALSLAFAGATSPGALSAADWVSFNGKQAASAILTALSNNSSNGLWAITGTGTGAARTITAGTGINVTNGDGASGNPTIASSVAVAAGTNVTVTTNGSTFTVNATGGGGASSTVSGGTGVSVTTNGSNYAVAIGQSVAASATPTFAGVALTGGTPVIGYAWICTSTTGAGYWAPVASASGFGGSGTAGYLAKFTTASTVGNSIITDNGSFIGVRLGATAPVQALDINAGNLRFETIAEPGAPTAAAVGSGGSLGAGSVYAWRITYVTAQGETALGTASTATTTVASDSVNLTFTTSASIYVTARRIYRNKIGDPVDYCLVATVSNNTATTYLDTTADGSLGATLANYQPNSTAGEFFINGSVMFRVQGTETAGGIGSMPTAGIGYNTAYGNLSNALSGHSGTGNTSYGASSLIYNYDANYNDSFGVGALSHYTVTGSHNKAFGANALGGISSGTGNIGIGSFAGNATYPATIDNYCGYIGYDAGRSVASTTALTNAWSIGEYALVGQSNTIAFGSATYPLKGSFGGNPTPARMLEVLDASGPQLRLSYSASSVYADVKTDSSGNLNFAPTGSLINLAAAPVIVNSSTPSSSSATGVAGQVAWDFSYVYVCTATNAWKRAAIATW
jgi:hypothetical protein